MSAKTTTDPVTGVALTAEESRRSGALCCLASLRQLIGNANRPFDRPEKAGDFFARQHGDAQAFAASLGSMPPFLEGAIIALAEYIHETETTGTPELDVWMPDEAKTKAERKRDIAGLTLASSSPAAGGAS